MQGFRFSISGYYGDSPLEGGGYPEGNYRYSKFVREDDRDSLIHEAKLMASHYVENSDHITDQLDYEFLYSTFYAQILKGLVQHAFSGGGGSTAFRYNNTNDAAYVTNYRIWYEDSNWFDEN